MCKSKYKYDGFISYRHLKYDETVAIKLQELLEGYKFPKGYKRQRLKIFLDKSEFAASPDLNDFIKENLDASEYLIVICTKELKKDMGWCKQEINYFKEKHNGSTDKILVLLADNSIKKSIPEELLCTKKEMTDLNGEKIYMEADIEPIGPDIGADSRRKALKKLKDTGYLRIVSAMANIPFSVLYDHQKKIRDRKIKTTIAIVSLLAIISLIVGFYMMWQNNEILKSNSLTTVNLAEKQLNSGDNIGAVKTIMSDPYYNKYNNKLLPEAVNILTDALNLYQNGSIGLCRKFPTDNYVVAFKHSFGGSHIAAIDSEGILYIWETSSGHEVYRKKFSNTILFQKCDFISENEFFIFDGGNRDVIDCISGTEHHLAYHKAIEDDSYYESIDMANTIDYDFYRIKQDSYKMNELRSTVVMSESKQHYLICNYAIQDIGIYRHGLSDGILYCNYSDLVNENEDISFFDGYMTDKNALLIFMTNNIKKPVKYFVISLDLYNGKHQCIYETQNYIEDMYIDNNGCTVVIERYNTNENKDQYYKWIYIDNGSVIKSLTVENEGYVQNMWSIGNEGLFHIAIPLFMEDNTYTLIHNSKQIALIDNASGELYYQYLAEDNEIIDIGYIQQYDKGTLLIPLLMDDGSICDITVYGKNNAGKRKYSGIYKDCSLFSCIGSRKYIVVETGTKGILLYAPINNGYCRSIYDIPYSYFTTVKNKYNAIYCGEKVLIYSKDTLKLISEIKTNETSYVYYLENQIALYCNGIFNFYDVNSGKCTFSFDTGITNTEEYQSPTYLPDVIIRGNALIFNIGDTIYKIIKGKVIKIAARSFGYNSLKLKTVDSEGKYIAFTALNDDIGESLCICTPIKDNSDEYRCFRVDFNYNNIYSNAVSGTDETACFDEDAFNLGFCNDKAFILLKNDEDTYIFTVRMNNGKIRYLNKENIDISCSNGAMGLSDDGRWIMIFDKNCNLYKLDVKSGEICGKLDLNGEFHGDMSITFINDNIALVSSSNEYSCLVDIDKMKLYQRLGYCKYNGETNEIVKKFENRSDIYTLYTSDEIKRMAYDLIDDK